MPTIRLETHIDAPIQQCFDLARNVDVHTESTSRTRERAIAGVTTGLLHLGDVVTWEAVHFGVRQRLTVRITEYDRPHCFVDELVRGVFKRLKHVHEFMPCADGTLMRDTFDFASPFGPIGALVDKLVLHRYMRVFLQRRNEFLKELAEQR